MPYSSGVVAYENTYQDTIGDVSDGSLGGSRGGSTRGSSSVFGDKVIPQNIEAEKAVLAAMILDEEILGEALIAIKAEAFYRPSHRKIYEAIYDLHAKGNPVDQISLAERLDAKGELESVGGPAYILELANNSFALANWNYHVQIVNRQALLRNLISAATRITALSYDAPDDTEAVVEQAEKLIFDVTDKQVKTEFRDLRELVITSIDQLEQLAKEKKLIQGISTGYRNIDEILSGMRGGDLIVLAARPGVGKTSLALNIALNAAKLGSPVAFFSLEMPAEQLIQRIMCTEARVDLSKMRTGSLSTADWQQLISACSTLSPLDFSIDDSSALSIMELRAKARRQLHSKAQGLIVVDYLQLMESHNAYKDRHLEVAEFSRGLKMLAKELDVPIIALSQLSRRVDDRQNKRPQLSDLRESGSIEQDADVVMFIDRSVNREEAESDKRPSWGEARVIIEKHRNGPTGVATLAYQAEYTRFDMLYQGPDEYVD